MSDERAKIIAALDAVRKAARDDHGCVFSRGDRRMLMVVRDLVEDQYVKGELERGPAGEVVSCSTRGLTTAGRRLLHELRQEARRESMAGRLRLWGDGAVVMGMAAVVSAVTAVLTTVSLQVLVRWLRRLG